MICANCFTFGGLRIDIHGRTIDLDGDPIPGLYAAGETAGLFYGDYTGATSVMRGAVFGRRAGRHAAGAIERSPVVSNHCRREGPVVSPGAALPANCHPGRSEAESRGPGFRFTGSRRRFWVPQ